MSADPNDADVGYDVRARLVEAQQMGFEMGVLTDKTEAEQAGFERGVKHEHDKLAKWPTEQYLAGVKAERERILAALDAIVYEDTKAKGPAVLIKLCDVLEATDAD